ncbi:MAG: MarR family winged helix-turn-helix transcriptional regulator [Mesorhizobium sp.]
MTDAPALDDDAAVTSDGKGDVSLGALERSAGLILRIAQLTVFEHFFEVFGQSDIKISEFTVLYAIAENPDVRQGVLADVLKIKWPNMTKLVRALEERGLIERVVPPENRRSVHLRVTPAGRRQIAVSQEQMYRSERMALGMLDDEEYAQLLRLSRKIAGWPPAPEAGRPEAG